MKDKAKIRILHIIDTTGPGGAETVLLNIVKNIDVNKYKSFVILPDEGWIYSKLRNDHDIEVKIINGSGKINFSFVYSLSKFVLENKIQIIHSHLFGSSLYGSIVGILCRVPVICTFHGFVDIYSSNIILKLKFLIIGLGAKNIVFVSGSLRKYLKGKFPVGHEKCITIFNGINIKETGRKNRHHLLRRYGLPENGVLVGSVGNIRQAKGYEILLKVAYIVRKQYSNCFFLIAGEGKGEIYDNLLLDRKRLGLEESVCLMGFQDDVATFLCSIDIFFLPSHTEGFSLSTIEAMNAGVPVVVTESGGPQEIVINNKNGIIVKAGDEAALAAGIIRLIESDKLKKKLAAMAKKTVSDKFMRSIMVQKYEDLYTLMFLRNWDHSKRVRRRN